MTNLYSKFIEIITLTVVVCSVYLLGMEIDKNTQATNIATFQKINSDINALIHHYATNPIHIKVNEIVRTEGFDSLSPEYRLTYTTMPRSFLRVFDVAHGAWTKEIITDEEKERFSTMECTFYQTALERNSILLVTDTFKRHLESNCTKQ